MTIRQLPKAPAIAMRSGLGFEIAPSALARFDGAVRAAEGEAEATISILGPVGQDYYGDGVTARRVAAALRAIGDKDVTVTINSPGGDFFEGLAIYNLLRDHPRQITVKVLGIAASAASVIAMAGDTILVPRAGFLMIHNVWVVAIGNRHDLREYADAIEPFDKVSAELYAARSGLDVAEVARMMDRETYIGGQDAVDKGFADDLLPADRVARDEGGGEPGASAALRAIDVAMARAGVPRAQRRQWLNQLQTGTPSAAEEVTPSADLDVNRDLAAMLADIAIR